MHAGDNQATNPIEQENYNSSALDAERPIFLDARPGMTVIVRKIPEHFSALERTEDWWMGEIIFCDGGARDPDVINLCQVTDIDTGVIRWINADLILKILISEKNDA